MRDETMPNICVDVIYYDCMFVCVCIQIDGNETVKLIMEIFRQLFAAQIWIYISNMARRLKCFQSTIK